MKNFKRITSIVFAAFVIFNCAACSYLPGNDTKSFIESTTNALYKATLDCSHLNGGDTTSRVIDDSYHENGIICFDCNEIVWSGDEEKHNFSNLDGICPCGYECEHGNGDDYHYEISEDSHTAIFTCNTCGSVIYEETNAHCFENNECVYCNCYNIELIVASDEIWWNDIYANTHNDFVEDLMVWVVYHNENELFEKYSNEGCSMRAHLLGYDFMSGLYTIKAYYNNSLVGVGSAYFGDVCSHSNGGDTTSRVIDDSYHENGIICFDCNEIVWSGNEEYHNFNNLDGTCPCGYECEHGNGDDYHYEVSEDSHTAIFTCNTCNSVIYEETNEHYIRDEVCIHCGYGEILHCTCPTYGDTVFEEFDDKTHRVGTYCATCDLTEWQLFETHFYYEGVCQLSMCKHTCEHSKIIEGECIYCGYQPSTGAYNQ